MRSSLSLVLFFVVVVRFYLHFHIIEKVSIIFCRQAYWRGGLIDVNSFLIFFFFGKSIFHLVRASTCWWIPLNTQQHNMHNQTHNDDANDDDEWAHKNGGELLPAAVARSLFDFALRFAIDEMRFFYGESD
jgi:hypothetical protein